MPPSGGKMFLLGSTGSSTSHVSSKRPGSPVKGKTLVSQSDLFYFPPRTLTQVMLCEGNQVIEQGTLVDSGADESFLDKELALRLNLKLTPLPSPLKANALDGRLLFTVTHCTTPVKMTINDTHVENIVFHVFKSAQHPIILGYPWLLLHNPVIDLRSGKVQDWGMLCKQKCVHDQSKLVLRKISTSKADCHNEPLSDYFSDYPDLSKVPTCYHDLKEVFSKARASAPHRPYDCAIDLLPGSTIPNGRLPLLPERASFL